MHEARALWRVIDHLRQREAKLFLELHFQDSHKDFFQSFLFDINIKNQGLRLNRMAF